MATPTVLPIAPLNITGQDLTPVDSSNVSNITLQNIFNTDTDIIQTYLYNTSGVVLRRLTTDYSVTSGKIVGTNITQLNLDPMQDMAANGFSQGKYQVNYNFIRPVVSGNPLFYIAAISSDRTELKVQNTSYTQTQLQDVSTALQSILNTGELFKGFYLDFGLDTLLLAVNVGYQDGNILIKLYESLPLEYTNKTNFNFVEKISEPVAFSVEYPQQEIIVDTLQQLKGPNLNIRTQGVVNNSTDFQNFTSLLNAPSASLTDQLKSILVEKRAELNTDYSAFENFVFFSSAEQRLINFYYKVSQIENYNNQITALTTLTSTPEISASAAVYQTEINKLITNFDGYDYYLYFESSSTAWPKSTSTKPYALFSTGSTQVLTWYTDQLNSASLYDEFNQNYIYNIYPNYIVEDTDNDQFKLFNEEVGQMFDQIWLYTKAIENRQDGDNSLSGGISTDLVADAIRSYGVSLYQSNFTSGDLYTSFLGLSPGGSTLPPTGSELITNYVTASAETTPYNDAQKLIYKRIYHNLPFLLKKKGTLAGLKVLLSCFGIPDTILRINEFGGKDENSNTWDNWTSEFNYALNTSGSNYVTSSFVLNTSWGATNNRPGAVEFRFKTLGIPTVGYYSQSLWSTDTGASIILKYTGSNTVSGSYSGSITSNYRQYGYLEFYPSASDITTTASIYLPFFDGGWWSVLVNNNGSSNFTVYAKNKLYDGVDGNTIGFQASASITGANNWSTATTSYFASSSLSAKTFSGSLQEIRYYKNALSESVFNDFVMNPNSTEGNNYTSSADELAFRATLGGELYTGSTSVHPKVSGNWITTSSFSGTSTFAIAKTPLFTPNEEVIFYDQVPVGIQNAVSDKIHINSLILPPSGSTNIPENTVLSTLASIQQKPSSDQNYTNDVNYVEIALSPQNEINDDINSSLGYFNLGEYIGDPRAISTDSLIYPDLDSLSKNYFQKYSDSYNWNDYTRLAKYFDNAVFKMIKDFIPARAGIATGIVIKQHLLERNRQRPAQTSYIQPEYTASVTSAARDYQTGSIEVFTGGAGGSVNVLTNLTQSWSSSLNTKAGVVNQINSSQYEFYNGEYSGSSITAQLSYQLNTTPLLNNVSESRKSIFYQDEDYAADAYRPTNYSLILSGSAYKAEVQDSNYSSGSAWFKARYSGTKLTSATYNSYTPGDISYGQKAVISNYSDYFAIFTNNISTYPELPGGSKFTLVGLVDINGQVYSLTGTGSYLSYVANTFKKDTAVKVYAKDISSAISYGNLVVQEGGAYYQTILYNSGSNNAQFTLKWANDPLSRTYTPVYFTASAQDVLIDNSQNWLYPMLTQSDANLGTVQYIKPDSAGQTFYFYNTKLQSFPTYTTTNRGITAYGDTLLPLQVYDYIRFGTTGSSLDSGSIDTLFNGLSLYSIKSITVATTASQTSSIVIAQTIGTGSILLPASSADTNQNYRIFRRIPDQTSVVITTNPQINITSGEVGLLIPSNFNPNYDPVSIAKAAGLIS